MNAPTSTHAFPTTRAVLLLTALAVICAAVSLAIARALGASGALVSALIVATAAVVWGLAMLGLLPVVVFAPRGVLPTVGAYFGGMGLRLAGALGGYLLVTLNGSLPNEPILYTLVGTYLPLMFAEAALVGRYLWRFDANNAIRPSAGLAVTDEVPPHTEPRVRELARC